jgi:hypothetical protein
MLVGARSKSILNAMFLVLALLVYARVWKEAPYWSSDTPSYVEVANDLRHFSLSHAHQRTPGLPLLLLLTGADKHPTRLFFYISLALYFSAVAILAYVLALLSIGTWRVRLFMLIASLPPFVEWAAQITSETLSEFLVVATFGSVAAWLRTGRTQWMVLTCLSGTAAALTRPTFEGVVVIIALGMLACSAFAFLRITPRQRLAAVAAALISIGAQTSYALVNYVKFGYFGTNTFAAYGLSHKVAGVVEFLPDRYAAAREILVRHRDSLLVDPRYDHTGQNYIYRALPELASLYGGDELAALKAIQRLSLYLIVHKPMSYLNECLKAMCGYWMPTDGPLSTYSPAWRSVWALTQFTILGMFFLQAIALAGTVLFHLPQLLMARKSKSMLILDPVAICTYIMGSLTIWYTMAVSCCFGIGLARYRVPTELLIMVVTLLGFRIWSQTVKSGDGAHNAGRLHIAISEEA